MCGFVISPLRLQEANAAVALWREAGLLRSWNDPHEDIALALEKPASTVLAGRIGDVLVATALVGHDGHRGWVYYLAVAAGDRAKGYGRRMMVAAEDWCRVRGVPKLQLMVRTENSAATYFYERLGYTRGDVVVMAKALDG